jgi:UDP-N-acetylglucosamine:LPS N-acetylglucosamine transferase
MNIGLVAETAPAKTLIPVIEKLDDNILSFTHSEGAYKLLEPYSSEIMSIGEGRRNTTTKRSDFTIGKLVLQDTLRTYRALKKKDIDLILTCGNAGDVRKGISAAKKLDIPKIHIEQDLYNPIEMIAYADLITVPNSHAKKLLKKYYDITNTVNIKGYPQAEYVNRVPITEPEKIYDFYGFDDFYVLFLGGDTRPSDIPEIIHEVEKLNKIILIIPYRFEAKSISPFVTRRGVYVIDGYVDLISLMNASQGVIYCAGMGVTIEVGALSVPAVKLLGFHVEHASNDLAQSLGIDVISVYDIQYAVSKMKKPHGSRLIKNGIKASKKIAELTRDMYMFDTNPGGRKSMRLIWNQRKKYR